MDMNKKRAKITLVDQMDNEQIAKLIKSYTRDILGLANSHNYESEYQKRRHLRITKLHKCIRLAVSKYTSDIKDIWTID